MKKIKSTVVTVNGVEWSESPERKKLACTGCGKLTSGRIERGTPARPTLRAAPCCMDCGLKRAMLPVGAVAKLMRGLFT